jgi:hypothetical protein
MPLKQLKIVAIIVVSIVIIFLLNYLIYKNNSKPADMTAQIQAAPALKTTMFHQTPVVYVRTKSGRGQTVNRAVIVKAIFEDTETHTIVGTDMAKFNGPFLPGTITKNKTLTPDKKYVVGAVPKMVAFLFDKDAGQKHFHKAGSVGFSYPILNVYGSPSNYNYKPLAKPVKIESRMTTSNGTIEISRTANKDFEVLVNGQPLVNDNNNGMTFIHNYDEVDLNSRYSVDGHSIVVLVAGAGASYNAFQIIDLSSGHTTRYSLWFGAYFTPTGTIQMPIKASPLLYIKERAQNGKGTRIVAYNVDTGRMVVVSENVYHKNKVPNLIVNSSKEIIDVRGRLEKIDSGNPIDYAIRLRHMTWIAGKEIISSNSSSGGLYQRNLYLLSKKLLGHTYLHGVHNYKVKLEDDVATGVYINWIRPSNHAAAAKMATPANMAAQDKTRSNQYVREVAQCVYDTMGNEGTHVSMSDCLEYSSSYADSKLPVDGACRDVVTYFNQMDSSLNNIGQ